MLTKIRYKLVFNRSRRLNKRGEGLVEIECTQNGRRIYFTTHTYAFPQNFANGSIIGVENADGLIVGSPVYYASLNGTLKSFLDKVFFAN